MPSGDRPQRRLLEMLNGNREAYVAELREITTGLRFPEGPVAMPDGSVLVVEIAGRCVTRVRPDGAKDIVARPGGGPNGLAIGPDSKCYVCNNGGFEFTHDEGYGLRPALQAWDYRRPHRADRFGDRRGRGPVPGHAARAAARAERHRFRRARRLLFHRSRQGRERDWDRGAVFYAKADGPDQGGAFPLVTPNGIGLSPDGTMLYVAETEAARLGVADPRARRAREATLAGLHGGRLVADPGGRYQRFDRWPSRRTASLRRHPDPWWHHRDLARRLQGRARPDAGSVHHQHLLQGPDLRTAYITLSNSGRLVAVDWPRPGLGLNYLET